MWPPPRSWHEEALSRLLRWCKSALARRRKGTYVGNVITAALAVASRAGMPLEADPRLADVRGLASRADVDRPVRQAESATPEDVQKLWLADPTDKGLLAVVLWYSLARCSDWARGGLLGAGPRPKDVRRIGRCTWLVQLRVTKPDPTGVSRRVAFTLPPAAASQFRRRVRRTPPQAPLWQSNTRDFYSWLCLHAPNLSAHSFRRGAVKCALQSGAPGKFVMRMTGHRDLRTLARYAGEVPVEWMEQMATVARALHNPRQQPRLGFPGESPR